VDVVQVRAVSAYLLVHNRAETGLALDDGVRHTHFPAKRWQEDDQLNRVNVVRDKHQRGLFGLDEGHDVVETVLDGVRLLADILLLLALAHGSGLLVQTVLLLSLRLRAVLVQELEQLRGGVPVEGVAELGDRWRDFEAHVEDLALALETDVLGPSYHAREVALRLDVLTDTEVAWAALDEGVLGEMSIDGREIARHVLGLTLACFLLVPALVPGNGAGAVFLPVLGGYH